ncbi:hypothetical protein TeGR_g7032 [Tetraparma gracilis]|uniref:Ankyrin repeat-containing domain protein n=1 Tax=Tetraparma gracilis TaxID=2962635 RepID=A0ABQ6N912_9STRA|nr:hypothetical protein TeGR_g7032 [Tetraparma gracilis]
MGQLLSSAPSSGAAAAAAPAPPPPLLSCAVVGDLPKYLETFSSLPAPSLLSTDSQSNNVLHALFSCANPDRRESVLEILEHVHKNVAEADLRAMYSARSQMGCVPLWILIAYGNVPALTRVLDLLPHLGSSLASENMQGDTCVLATTSKGNVDMLSFLETAGDWNSSSFSSLLSKPNKNGTTPIQIAVANSHLETLDFLLSRIPSPPLLEPNRAGLSLFHICAERGFAPGFSALLARATLAEALSLKDKNGASPLHVAAFCNNADVVGAIVGHADATGELLDAPDGDGRSAYWLAMLKGGGEAAELLRAAPGVEVGGERMLQEIKESDERRDKSKKERAEQALKLQ